MAKDLTIGSRSLSSAHTYLWVATIGLVLSFAPLNAVAQETQSTASDTVGTTPPTSIPVYNPPDRGAPKTRIGASTRGDQTNMPDVYVLAPEQIGLTATDQPTLYWYVSKPVQTYEMELSLLGDNADDPLLKIRVVGDIDSGIHSLAIADHGVRLSPNIDYEFSAALVVDPNERSKDIFAMGVVRSVEADSQTQASISAAEMNQKYAIWADRGYWYDALHAASQLVDTDAMASVYRNHRAALLDQEGLTDVAAFERTIIAN